MIQGVVFDLDGTLINSEPLWEEAQRMVLSEQGMNFTHRDYLEAKGLPTFEAINIWYDKIENPTKEAALLIQEINKTVIRLVKDKGELQEGVIEILDFWKSKNLPMGIASAASMAHVKTALDKYNLNKYFNLIYSGDFERYGKPHPGIYISACKKLKIDPTKSVAFEDSFNGILAAKAARMVAVALLDGDDIADSKFGFADLRIKSLLDFNETKFEQLNALI